MFHVFQAPTGANQTAGMLLHPLHWWSDSKAGRMASTRGSDVAACFPEAFIGVLQTKSPKPLCENPGFWKPQTIDIAQNPSFLSEIAFICTSQTCAMSIAIRKPIFGGPNMLLHLQLRLDALKTRRESPAPTHTKFNSRYPWCRCRSVFFMFERTSINEKFS